MAKLRLFVGISAPENWRREIMEWRRTVEPRFSRSFGRWTSEQNLHLTLRFFGSVDESEVAAICAALKRAVEGTTSFRLEASEFGCFPTVSRPRIFWLGFDGDVDALTRLESNIRAETSDFGQPPEARKFHPHLTLARLSEPTRTDRDNLQHIVKKERFKNIEPWSVTELELIRSDLRPGGSIYTQIASIPLL